MSRSPTYHAWAGMIQRCYNENQEGFPNYGARGITVCVRWRVSFVNFLDDMGEKPAGRSIDRIDNNGHYSPENCRWATPTEQQNNKRNSISFELAGEFKTPAEVSQDLGVPASILRARLRRGWTKAEATGEIEHIDSRSIAFNGETGTITQWAQRLGISKQAISFRLKRGWSVEKALTTPRTDYRYQKESHA